MTTSKQPMPVLRRAALRASAAASFYNTQPWRIELTAERISLLADRGRQLTAHDPSGRQLTISCGCALLNARVSLARDGCEWTVSRFPAGPAPGGPLAVLQAGPDSDTDPGNTDALARLADVVGSRHTNRRPFLSDALPRGIIGRLRAAATAEGADLQLLDDPEQREAVLSLQHAARRIAGQNPAYQAEHRAWAQAAGFSTENGEHPGGATETASADTDPLVPGVEPKLLLLSTRGDAPQDWLRAGEALQRVLLEISAQDCAVSLHSPATQVPSVRAQLREQLALDGHPQLLLQVGTAAPGSPTRRRRLMEVISERVQDS
jgi:hypothetical protein